jgi:hypothetical protein
MLIVNGGCGYSYVKRTFYRTVGGNCTSSCTETTLRGSILVPNLALICDENLRFKISSGEPNVTVILPQKNLSLEVNCDTSSSHSSLPICDVAVIIEHSIHTMQYQGASSGSGGSSERKEFDDIQR